MSNKPKLRFKEFNDSIVECRIENVLKIKHGKDQKAIECKDGIYPILATSGEIGRTNTYLWNKPCVLIGRKGTINKPQYMDTPFWTVDTLFYSDVNSSNNAKYLYYLFNTINWKRYDESTGVPSLSAKTVERIKVIITNNKDEQKKIAEFLSKVDEVISEREEEVKDLEQQKKGLMQKIFSQELRFTDSNNNPYPDWEDTILGNIYDFKYGQYNNNPDNGGQYPIYGANGIIGGYTEYNAENSVIIGHMGAYAGSVLFEKEKHFVTYNGTITIPKSNVVLDSKYGYYLLLNLNIRRICDGSGQPFLSYDTLNRIKIKTSKINEEQQKIAKVLSKLDELIEEKKALLSDWQSFKKGLLQQMFV